MAWRWDQGRLEYFQFDTIRKIAKTLLLLEGSDLRGGADLLRGPLTSQTSLPFRPSSYTVWRNYGRVFGCQLLAAQVDNRLICTQICRDLTSETSTLQTVDDYLSRLTRVFYFPSPVFEGYSPTATQVFPFCAILKLLVSKASANGPRLITVSEIFEKIIANNCTGREPLEKYVLLKSRHIAPTTDQVRQVRELVRFMSQFTFLKWQNPNLFLDASGSIEELAKELDLLTTPIIKARETDRGREILSLGHIGSSEFYVPEMKDRIFSEDEEFVEGRKVRVTHLRTERSRKLREMFFALKQPPYRCDMCALRMNEQYPWADNLLEVHHLLPLSSPLKYESGKTSVKDLVELCPNCHKAIHNFYRRWLKTSSQDDFQSYAEALDIYKQAKGQVVLS